MAKKLYAIIDIETTGGRPFQDKITEIAILIHDGERVIDTYSTLINPERYISDYITKLTGISNDMVKAAPKFFEVAKEIIEFTEGKIFVAHNVSFDYSFIKAEFKSLGYNYQRKTLCTVRLSRKLIQGVGSYSLGNICKFLNIRIKNRHRAGGDAAATAQLFSHLYKIDKKTTEQSIKGTSVVEDETSKVTLPPQISRSEVEALPEDVGVYYFINDENKIIYVGKSKNIRKRVASHFQTYHKTRKQGEMKNQITRIEYTLTGSELVALLLESDEIKRIKPKFNRAQRRSVFNYGVFYDMDDEGYIRFYTDKLSGQKLPAFFADSAHNARKILIFYAQKHQLCLKLCDLYQHAGACFDYHIKNCNGACIGEENPQSYNERALQVISHLTTYAKPNFFIIGRGRQHNEKSLVCIENGKYIGFGYITTSTLRERDVLTLKSHLVVYKDNKDVQKILRDYLKNTADELWYY